MAWMGRRIDHGSSELASKIAGSEKTPIFLSFFLHWWVNIIIITIEKSESTVAITVSRVWMTKKKGKENWQLLSSFNAGRRRRFGLRRSKVKSEF